VTVREEGADGKVHIRKQRHVYLGQRRGRSSLNLFPPVARHLRDAVTLTRSLQGCRPHPINRSRFDPQISHELPLSLARAQGGASDFSHRQVRRPICLGSAADGLSRQPAGSRRNAPPEGREITAGSASILEEANNDQVPTDPCFVARPYREISDEREIKAVLGKIFLSAMGVFNYRGMLFAPVLICV